VAQTACLVGIDRDHTPLVLRALAKAAPHLRAEIARFDVAELRALVPELLICDIDGAPTDPLELLHQVRFVVPACVIGVYTKTPELPWALACHLAGASGIFLQRSTVDELAEALRETLRGGCFTDPRFAAVTRVQT